MVAQKNEYRHNVLYLLNSKCPKSVSSVGDDVSNEGQHNFY